MSEGPTGYTAYSHTGWGAEHGESEKWASWKASIKRADELSAGGVELVAKGRANTNLVAL